MRKTLGVNISHNVSFAYFENDVLKEYYEEDRFNKIKNFMPLRPYLKKYNYIALKKFKNIFFDSIVFCSLDRGHEEIDKSFMEDVLKDLKYKNAKFYYHQHHIFHAVSGFYFSNFKDALALISDGGGEYLQNSVDLKAFESIYYINNERIKTFYQHYSNATNDFFNIFDKAPVDKMFNNWVNKNYDFRLSNKLNGGARYTKYTYEAGFKEGEEGQLMGIAAYKNKNTDLDKNVLEIANKAQDETLQEKIELIEKAQTYSDCKNIILSGGYHLNCSNNFKLVKHFPKLNIFVDPISYDGGTAVGVAYYHEKNFKN